MQSYPFELEYYFTTNGRAPFKEWLAGLKDITARAKIRVRLDRVRLGNLGNSRSLGYGIHELKIDYGPGYRVYYAYEDKRVILLLIGGDKSRQAKDIVEAKSFWEDWRKRKNV